VNKKIFVVVRSISFADSVGGMEKAAKDHILEMVNVGYHVTLLCPRKKIVGNIPDGVTYIDISWPKWDRYKIAMTMGLAYNRWCKKVSLFLNTHAKHNDIIHFHGASAGTLGFLDSNIISKTITVVNPHGMEEFGSGSIFRLANRFFTKRLIKQSFLADAIIATDNLLIPVVKNNLGVNDDKVFLIPNTIDVQKNRSVIGNKKNELNAEHDGLNIVSIGRLEYNKGYDILGKALSIFQSQNPKVNVNWTHYGRGKKKQSLLKLCIKENVSLRIIENASDIEVQNSLYTCDVFIQPSRYEGSSLTTLEAMVHGCLIVAMPVGGIPDKIVNQHTGFLCEDITPQSLYETLNKALQYEDIHIIKENAKVFVESTYDIMVSTRKYVALYESFDK